MDDDKMTSKNSVDTNVRIVKTSDIPKLVTCPEPPSVLWDRYALSHHNDSSGASTKS